ncbi:MAG: hypothetical protein HY216_05970 [Candidatus Rokubacteria bacterium]|nr:hypothetical protein [Candidatus Rokubacteria bacterium]
MSGRAERGLLAALFLVAVIAAPARGEDAPYRLLDLGALGVGLGVSKLKPAAPDPLASSPAPSLTRPGDLDLRTYDPRSAVISFDLTLRWPAVGGHGESTGVGMLQPYLSLGPALLVAEAQQYALLRRDRDYAVSVGVKGGAGVSWRLDRNLSLFGEYGFTRTADEVLGGRPSDTLDTTGFRYGVEIRF